MPVEPPHPKPVIIALQNALGPQCRQRLAKRGAADRQCSDKLGFLEPRAGSQLSSLNGIKVSRRNLTGVAVFAASSSSCNSGHFAQVTASVFLTCGSFITYLYTDVYR